MSIDVDRHEKAQADLSQEFQFFPNKNQAN